MPERIDARPAITVIGGAVLLISLFMNWFEVPAVPPTIAAIDSGNAWAVFESLDLVLAGTAILAIYVAFEQMTGRERLGEAWSLVLGLLALVVVVSQLLDGPPSIAGAEPDTGAWFALGGAAAMLVGGILSSARVSLALELDSESRSRATTRRRATQES